jgi:hypothetical protein
MRYVVRKSIITVLGRIWMPAIVASQQKDLDSYDVENIRGYAEHLSGGDTTITRDAVEHWLMLHSGDFSEILDFRASIEDGDQTIEFDWAEDDSEDQYLDTIATEDD